jgi:cytochrome c oxidase cbb3-type subunit III
MTTLDHDKHIDPVTGIATTGHEWDGLTELNHPLPRWWLWIFYACIVFSIGYWIVYPSWPLITSYVGGVSGWHSRSAVVTDLEALKALRGPNVAKLAATPLADIEKDASLLDFTLAYGRVAFRENCAACHGAGGGGARGYPSLLDDDWLWGGSAEAILQTVSHGVRNADPDSRQGGPMPAFGRDGILKPEQITNVASYVRSLSGLDVDPSADIAAGAKVFAETCAVCHGADGKGKRDIGSPNLTDAVWLYGSSLPTMLQTINNGRGGSMPSWGERLDPTTIKALTVFVHSLGGGE